MDPLALRAAFRVALLIVIVAVAMLPFQPAGSAEAVVTVMAAAVGGLFIAAVWAAARLGAPRLPRRDVASGDKPSGEAQSGRVSEDRDQ
jgi:hypothetical protein